MNPVLALIITNIIWGAAPPIFKFSLFNIPPYLLGFIRFFFAALIFLPFVFKKWKKIDLKSLVEIYMASLFGMTMPISFFYLGLEKGESINVSIIGSAGPIFLFIFAVFFLKEKFHKKIFLGMALAFIGVLVVVLSPLFMGDQNNLKQDLQANIFFVLATVGSVMLPLMIKTALKKINVWQITFLIFLFTAINFLLPALYDLQGFSLSSINLNGWVGIIFGVFLSSLLAYFLFFWGMSKISTQEIGVFSYIDPIVTLLIAIPLLGERPTIFFFLGAILVFLGIFVAEGRLHWHPIHKLREKVL